MCNTLMLVILISFFIFYDIANWRHRAAAIREAVDRNRQTLLLVTGLPHDTTPIQARALFC
jgi:hypothetical protein